MNTTPTIAAAHVPANAKIVTVPASQAPAKRGCGCGKAEAQTTGRIVPPPVRIVAKYRWHGREYIGLPAPTRWWRWWVRPAISATAVAIGAPALMRWLRVGCEQAVHAVCVPLDLCIVAARLATREALAVPVVGAALRFAVASPARRWMKAYGEARDRREYPGCGCGLIAKSRWVRFKRWWFPQPVIEANQPTGLELELRRMTAKDTTP